MDIFCNQEAEMGMSTNNLLTPLCAQASFRVAQLPKHGEFLTGHRGGCLWTRFPRSPYSVSYRAASSVVVNGGGACYT